jgi:hypothetical protein
MAAIPAVFGEKNSTQKLARISQKWARISQNHQKFIFYSFVYLENIPGSK